MAKTNKNTHNALVWNLQRSCIITLRSTYLNTSRCLSALHTHTHTDHRNSQQIPHSHSHKTLPSHFSLLNTHTYRLTHTPEYTDRHISKERCGSAADHAVHKGEIFSSFLTQAVEVLIALLSQQNFQGKRCYPWWISTVATSDWFFQLGHVPCISYISLKQPAERAGEAEVCR